MERELELMTDKNLHGEVCIIQLKQSFKWSFILKKWAKLSTQEVLKILIEKTFLRRSKIKNIKAEINEIDDKKPEMNKTQSYSLRRLIRWKRGANKIKNKNKVMTIQYSCPESPMDGGAW